MSTPPSGGQPPGGRGEVPVAALLAVAGAVLALSLAAGTLGSLLDSDDAPGIEAPGNDTVIKRNSSAGGGGGAGPDGGPPLDPPVSVPDSLVFGVVRNALPVVGVVLLGGALAVLVSVSRGDGADAPPPADGDDGDGLGVTDERAGAGRVSIPGVPLTNDVYRAWAEFQGLVAGGEEDATTATPAELGDRARRTADRPSVETLLDTFRRVRYRGDDPSAALERRARDALDRVQATYDSPDGDPEADPDRDGGR